LLLYFLTETGRLFWLSQPLTEKIQSFIERSENGYIPKKGTVEGPIARIWARYQQTFVDPEGKTEDEAAEYFTERALVGGTLNLRYWKAVPNLLVGIGILGTFVGLTVGISDFETQSVDTVRASIEDLLSGMATAFVSSIAGMLLSLVFNGLEKWRFGRLNQDIRRLCGALDAQYLMKESDRRALQQKEQRQVLTEVFAYEDGEHEILPAHVFRDLRQQAREQTQTLKSFSTELADGIMISTMTINKLGEELGEAFQMAMQQRLTPTMENVQDAVEQLRNEKAASNEDMVQNVVDRLSATLEDISGQFQESLSGGALDQLEKTAETVGEMGELLASFQSDFASMSEDLKESVETMAEKTGEEAHAATKRMRQESEGAARTMRSEMEKATESVGQEIESLQNNSADLLRRQQASAEAVQSLLDEGGDVAGRLKETANSLQDTLRRLRQVSETLDRAANWTQESGETLQASTKQFQEHQQSWLSAEKETLSQLESTVDEMRNLSSEYTQQFERIRGGLKDIFGEIEQGLSDYQNTTRESINGYLSDLAENLQTATNALSGTVTALDESFDELHEVLDKMSGRANGRR
jgi:methyl-accepting chemotaxis protein